MRKLCPNFDKEDGLETVLEVPIPEEMFKSMGSNVALRWQNLRACMKGQWADKSSRFSDGCGGPAFRLLLKLVGSPLIPVQIFLESRATFPIKDSSIEASTAKYILQQYIAATGGWAALNAVNSLCAVGQVRMVSLDMSRGEDCAKPIGDGEVGGFVLWQKNPDMWYLELVVSGCKVSAGSDGKVAWSQTSSQASHANRGPPRPSRRFFQGLDPRFIANLFVDAVCIGEKTVNSEECFILKIETGASILKAQSTPKTEIVHHMIWGYFSMRTGLLIQLEDTKLVRMKSLKGENSVFWVTNLESTMENYRYVDGLNIAHGGKTTVTLYRYGEAANHKQKIEETWSIEEVDFNIWGLSMEAFLPPADLKRDPEVEQSILLTCRHERTGLS